jgi:anti-sigma factor RsiW
MNHPRPEDLSAYVDDGVAPADHRAIADHLATCVVCVEVVRRYLALRTLLQSNPAVEPEPWFAERMEAMVAGEVADVERWTGPERVAARAVVALALVVLGLTLATTLRQEGAPPTVDRMLAVESGDTTTLLASSELTRENLLQATIVGE